MQFHQRFCRRNNGVKRREECSKDFASLDAAKIKAIQISIGSRYLENSRGFAMTNENESALARQ
jgi:hypothetical protein